VTPQDLQRIRSSSGWRTHRSEIFRDCSVGSVLVKGQRAPRPAWRHQLLNGFARLAGLPMLRAAPAHGGARAQEVEVQRLRQLAAAGVPVPQVLHVEADFFVQSYVGEQRLDALLQLPDAALWWQRGLRALVELHANGQYLSQAFARNFIASGDRLVMIDFEDDPLEVLPLYQAQARDWLAYLHSSARVLRAHSAAQQAAAIDTLRAELACEAAPVRALVAATARRLRWVQRLQAGDGRGWRRHVAILQSAVALMLAAEIADDNPRNDPKVSHARHH
jgi:tRNA A-37 threonylcarbamoyl transferase component Bud32